MGGKKRVVEKKKKGRKKVLAEVLPADCRSERKHRKFLGRSIITRLKIVSNDDRYSRGEGKLSRGKNRLDRRLFTTVEGTNKTLFRADKRKRFKTFGRWQLNFFAISARRKLEIYVYRRGVLAVCLRNFVN